MQILCLDLEGVLIPEIWIAFAEETGIEALKATTRDIPDYDQLMQQRLRLLDQHQLTLPAIQSVIAKMKPLQGASDFLAWARENFQVVILSDTYYEFAMPFMRQLNMPTLLCHRLEVNNQGRIVNYKLRQTDPKRASVKALQALNYRIVAVGDSYNDTSMLLQAEQGILFHAPEKVKQEFPQLPAVDTYADLQKKLVLFQSEL